VRNHRADYVFHPPTGSSVPGKEDANPYLSFPPDSIRGLLKNETDEEKIRKMRSALKQWERQYDGRGYPFRKMAKRIAANVIRAELTNPPGNLNFYQDTEVPEGFESILDSLQSVHDNYNAERFDITRQGERPIPDVLEGDFSSPSAPPVGGVVKPLGEGPEPEGMEILFPATGGNLDGGPWLT
jgi:hypothetical protein